MIKLKEILKESSPGFENRQFGDPLPTLEDIKKNRNKVNERTDSRAKRDLMRAFKNSKVSHAYSYDNDQIAMEMTNDETYIIGNIRRYEDD
tara:strand:+ start:62 stop:334 length:273 start_codon:yes stop_codon:yes gene_type:complete